MPIELNTPDSLQYQFFPFNNGIFQFRVRAANDAHLALTTGPNDAPPVVEIFIGGWGNTKSVIRANKQKPEKAECHTPNILSPGEYRGFWVRVTQGIITVGREGEAGAFLTWQDPQPFYANYIGVCTGWGAAGSWIIEDLPNLGGGGGGWAPPASQLGGFQGSSCWVPSQGGQVPPGAVQGGQDGEAQYVARARHEGDLIPAKLVPSHNVAYVAYGGGEHPHSQYEVLCGCNPQWIPVTGGNIPPNAVPAGETKEGEPLFVGRVQHEGAVTIGKVQQSHGVCYIPYGGQELSFPSYELLLTN